MGRRAVFLLSTLFLRFIVHDDFYRYVTSHIFQLSFWDSTEDGKVYGELLYFLSTLFLRFVALTWMFVNIQRMNFQLSFWDSLKTALLLMALELFFQLSFWDSAMSINFLRMWGGTFNSLFEILFYIGKSCMNAITFNSLFEIHRLLNGKSSIIFLSTLFLRFTEHRRRRSGSNEYNTFNSLFEIPVCWQGYEALSRRGFQLSFWDSWLAIPEHQPLLGRLAPFNSLFEILLFRRVGLTGEAYVFQLSFWDS